MAISDAQKIDLLWKKIGFGKAKTDTNSNKKAPNEPNASTINGWLDCGITYAGAGTPGGDTGNGGNGSNGCAFTSGDRILDGTAMSNDSFTFTLGDQNGTGATGNNILVRIKLNDGDSLTAISIA